MAAPIRIDTHREEPVYAQIAGRIRERIAQGELPPGSPLPPVRTLASDLGVNLNTVARAYRRLEEEGFVRIRSRSGVEVRRPAERPDRELQEALAGELRKILARMRQAGLEAADIRAIADRELRLLTPMD